MLETIDPASAQRSEFETVASKIATIIQTGNLKPGDKLPTERSLASQLEVGRGVVRDAIKVLSAAGIVRARQGSGLYVAETPHPFAAASVELSLPPDPAHIAALIEFREVLETQAARFAAERARPRDLIAIESNIAQHREAAERNDAKRFRAADLEFHQAIATASGNEFLGSVITTTLKLQNTAVDLAVSQAPGSMTRANDQHATILRAIRSADPDAAANAMRRHLQATKVNYFEELQRQMKRDESA